MSVLQPNLPYESDALEPHLSRSTVEIGYQRYHRMAIDTLNARIADSEYSGMTLEQVIEHARARGDDAVVGDACEAWNHGYFWQCMNPADAGGRGDRLQRVTARHFGSRARLRSQLMAAAEEHAGRGWLWIAWGQDGLEICHTAEGESLTSTQDCPLAVLDLRSYAYTRDFGGDARAYASAFIVHLFNWDVAASMLDGEQQLKAA